MTLTFISNKYKIIPLRIKIGNHMTKKEFYKLKIEECLKKSSHSIINLKNNFKYINKPKWSEHSFYEALMELLKENAIVISGYDLENHIMKKDRMKKDRRQSFKQDWVELDWIKSEQTQILALLNLMEDSDIEKTKKAKVDIFASFKTKFIQYTNQEMIFYNTICSKVVSVSIKEWIKIKHDEIDKQMLNPSFHDPDNLDFMTYIYEELDRYQKESENNPNAEMWHLKGLTQDELNEINILNGQSYREGVGVDEDRYFPMYYPNSTTVKQYLNKLNVLKPVKSEEEIRRIFNRILFFVNTHENYNFMKQSFALALSHEEESTEFFEQFLNYANPRLEKLKKAIGIR